MNEEINFEIALNSSAKSVRLRSAWRSFGNYELRTGELLVKRLFVEDDQQIQLVLVNTIIPVWLPLLSSYLENIDDWPFDFDVTEALISSLRGLPLKSLEPFVSEWRNSEEIAKKYLAALYLIRRDEFTSGYRLLEQLVSEVRGNTISIEDDRVMSIISKSNLLLARYD